MTTKPNIVVTQTSCGNNADYPPTQIPTATGGALQFPGLPYGTYTVCVDNAQSGFGAAHATVTGVANTNYTAGNIVPVNFYSGASGYGSGLCQSNPSY